MVVLQSNVEMTTVSTLSVVLSHEEVETINETVRQKLELFIKKNEGDLATLKIQFTKLQTQSGKDVFNVDLYQIPTFRF